jgi:hypothetical protein
MILLKVDEEDFPLVCVSGNITEPGGESRWLLEQVLLKKLMRRQK